MAYTSIDDPTLYFNTKLYIGNGTAQSITGVGFKPDWVWIKDRTIGNSHRLFDGVRGVTKILYSNSDTFEETVATSLTSFTADGFDSGSDSGMNGNTNSYVSWNWLASNTTASNTVGDINSTVSVNTTSGFSIVSYTGTGSVATVGHSLGVAPKMYIVKRRDAGGASWCVYHASVGNTGALFLNDSVSTSVSSSYWNNTSPTANVFTVGGTNQAVNASGGTYVGYCFAEVKGFSKIGSYIGNGSTDGTFVYTGFKPAFLIIKRTDASANWRMVDNKRNTFNVMDKKLSPNASNAESTETICDFLSNGFKMKSIDGAINGSGVNFIYLAFASNPFVTSTGIPTTAR